MTFLGIPDMVIVSIAVLIANVVIVGFLFAVFSNALILGLSTVTVLITSFLTSVTIVSRLPIEGVLSLPVLVVVVPVVMAVSVIGVMFFGAVCGFVLSSISDAIFGTTSGRPYGETKESSGDVDEALFTVKPPSLKGVLGMNFGSWSFSTRENQDESETTDHVDDW